MKLLEEEIKNMGAIINGQKHKLFNNAPLPPPNYKE
jgi:hypothetical protein